MKNDLTLKKIAIKWRGIFYFIIYFAKCFKTTTN